MDLSAAATMNPNEARKAFLEYRDAFRKTASEIDEALMKGYREIAAGRQVLYLPDTIREGGRTEEGYPKLAIARADWTHVTADMKSQCTSVKFTRDRWTKREGACNTLRMPPSLWPAIPGPTPSDARAIVPLVPPRYRPPAALSNYHILFEAEWKPIPPRDPALLKDLGGGMYAVLAVWDLTDLEMKVLGMVRRGG